MAYSNITKTAMAEAMKKLMNEKPFSKISVGDICEWCGMNRKTFYYHFKDKYDLVNWIFQTEFLEMLRVQNYNSGWELLSDICKYLYSERGFYTNALQVEGQNSSVIILPLPSVRSCRKSCGTSSAPWRIPAILWNSLPMPSRQRSCAGSKAPRSCRRKSS